MDAIKYFNEKARMTEFCLNHCNKCSLSGMRNGRDMICRIFELRYPEDAIKIVEEWSKEHPQKTYLMDFLGKYPNCNKGDNGIPDSCRDNIYGTQSDCRCTSCEKCWNEPMEN